MRSLNRKLVIELFIAYCAGIVLVGVLSVPVIGIFGPLAAIVASILGLPVLIFVSAIAGFFPMIIVRYKKPLCLIAPIVVAFGWFSYEFGLEYATRGFSWNEYIGMYHVHQRVGLAFSFAFAVSAIFYRRTRGLGALQPPL